MRIKIQYVHHREHSVLPLEMPVREYCAGKYTLFFFVRTIRYTSIHCGEKKGDIYLKSSGKHTNHKVLKCKTKTRISLLLHTFQLTLTVGLII